MFFQSIARHVLDAVHPQGLSGNSPAPEALCYGFVTEGFDAAFDTACRRLRVRPLQNPIRGFGSKSCGGEVELTDGGAGWLKVSGIPRGSVNVRRERERSAGTFGIRTPRILAATAWGAGGIDWYAVLMPQVSSPTIKQFVDAGGSLAQDDRWIGLLRTALAQIAAIPTTQHRLTRAYVAQTILTRFGPDAPNVATEWRTAHGDLNWTNLTVPDLVVYDWETWGLAPRGYDEAYLMVHSIEDVSFMDRLEREFADDFSTQSGCVSLLVACAEMLNYIEADRLGAHHGRNVAAIAQRGLARYFDARGKAPSA